MHAEYIGHCTYIDVAMILYYLPYTTPPPFSVLQYGWLPSGYLFVHVVLILILLWAAHNKESAVAVIIVSWC